MPTTANARVELGGITNHNLKQLKKLNAVVFPISYTEKFYKDVLELGEHAKLAYFNDVVVGGVCCRVETEGDQRKLYIMTLGVLAPYRRLGVGTVLLDHVLKCAKEDGSIDCIYLHVQVSNDEALEFYQRFGFSIVDTKEQYYKRIDPPHAFVLQKDLKNHLGLPIDP